MIVPLYNAEIAPPEVRGSLVALQQLAITFGIMVSFWIDYGESLSYPERRLDINSLHARHKLHRRNWRYTEGSCMEATSCFTAHPRSHSRGRHSLHAILTTVSL